MNKVILMGNIGQDPAITYTQNGLAVCKISIATNEKIKGEKVVSWHRCVAFSKTAELIEKYIEKGDRLLIEGKIKYDSYDKDGTSIYTTDIIINTIEFINNKQSQNNEQKPSFQKRQNDSRNNQKERDPNNHNGIIPPDDDLPF